MRTVSPTHTMGPRRDARLRRMRRGFSLIELLGVMAVMSVIALAASPAMRSLSATTVSANQRGALALFAQARARAVATGAAVWLSIDLPGQRIAALSEDPSSPGRAGATPIIDAASGAALVLRFDAPGGARLTDASIAGINDTIEREIGFDALGRPILSSGDTLMSALLTFAGGGSVSVVPDTGLAVLTP